MKLDILAFGAHPDDVELSAGGTLAKHVDLGYKVGIIDLTPSQLSTRGTIENRALEAEEARKALGVHVRENLMMHDGFFEVDRPHLMQVVQVIRKYQPEIIIANAPDDRHPDHGKAAKLVKEANFLSGLVKIESELDGAKQSAWRSKTFFHYIQFKHLEPDVIVDIRGYKEQKLASLLAYKSQFYDPNSKEPETLISSKGFFEMIQSRNAVFGGMSAIFEGEGFISQLKPAVDNLFDLKGKL
ncbi:bacillithiol biosynthesis deacetylase BshB1 [bacterium]|nr:bacillithiol biosynthesis deacetylase BshB1 [bacterium]